MKTSVKVLIVLLLVLDLILAALVFAPIDFSRKETTLQAPETEPAVIQTLPPVTEPAPTEIVFTAPPETTEETLPPETEAPTTEATEPEKKNTFMLTFVGDCTLGTSPGTWNAGPGFIKTIGSDLSYPWKNVAAYFQEDDFSLINLEGPLADGGSSTNGKTSYRGPTEYVKMLTDNKIEAVTLANDHIHDYGDDGYASTIKTLEAAGVAYGENTEGKLITLDSGLTIGLYAVLQRDADEESVAAAVTDLKDKGAELIIVAPHWGIPGNHSAADTQKKLAHAAIDAGAKIVVGTHPHVLQPIEEYGDGIIYYSLGRFVFGGASVSKEWDTAIIQQEVIRNDDGSISLGEMTAIPASIGNKPGINNYQPTLYQPEVNPKHTESYGRVMDDLNLEH